MPAENLTLYAGWNKKDYSVVWTDYDGTVLKRETVLYGENAEAPENPARDGYKFIGWSSEGTNITANQVITAEYEKIDVPSEKNDDTVHDSTVKDDNTDGDSAMKDDNTSSDSAVKDDNTASDSTAKSDSTVGDSAVKNDTAANSATKAENTKITVKIRAAYKVPVKNAKPKKVTKTVKSGITLYTKKCRTAQFTAVITGTKDSVKWSTSNAKIVSVSSAGRVKAKREGTAYVSAVVAGQVTKIKVTVKKAGMTVRLNQKMVGTKLVKLAVGKTYTLRTTSAPAGKVLYQSANRKILKVSKSGKLTVLRSGTTCITVKCNGNRKKIKVLAR
jgi:hypothetical protein